MSTRTEKKRLSSIAGRQWLKKTSDASDATSTDTKIQEDQVSSPTAPASHLSFTERDEEFAGLAEQSIESVSIDIPDVSQLRNSPVAGFGPVNAATPAFIAKTTSDLVETANSDLSEKTSDWGNADQNSKTPRATPKTEPQTGKDTTKNTAIETLCTTIIERFPLLDSAVILFAGSEPNTHVDETCARVASELATRDFGRILLVDSDLKSRALSTASELAKEPGILDVKEHGNPWKPLVYGGSSTNLDFMPAGIGFKFVDVNKRSHLINAVAEMKKEYKFVLVSVGDAHSVSARVWSDLCDGSYLLVSMKKSNETIAQSAVAELKACGARLLGCVVTDVD